MVLCEVDLPPYLEFSKPQIKTYYLSNGLFFCDSEILLDGEILQSHFQGYTFLNIPIEDHTSKYYWAASRESGLILGSQVWLDR